MDTNNTDAAKQAKLNAQWPKKCGCGRVYYPHATIGSAPGSTWHELPLARTSRAPDGGYRDEYATHEMRNCACGSTLVVLTEIHDLDAE